MEVNFQIYHYWRSQCAMKGVKMIVFVCIDDRGGMMFNHRRLSQDRRLREYILELTAGGRLWMNAYSREQFPEDAPVCTDENFLSRASEGEFCFVEDQELFPFGNKKLSASSCFAGTAAIRRIFILTAACWKGGNWYLPKNFRDSPTK